MLSSLASLLWSVAGRGAAFPNSNMPSQPCPSCASEFASQSVLDVHIAHAHLTHAAAQPTSPDDYGYMAMTASQYEVPDEEAAGPQRNGVDCPYEPVSSARYSVCYFPRKALRGC